MTQAITVDGGETFSVTDPRDSLLQAALRAGVGFPHECGVGGCGACRFDLLDGAVETLWADAPGLSERDRKRGKRLACQSRPLGPCTVRVRCADEYRPVRPQRRHRVRLTARRALTHDMTEFTFQAAEPADFLPGQYALLALPGVSGWRAYSMANAANADGLWQFIIRRVPGGQGTAVLFDHLTPGAALDLDGPCGHAHWRAESPRPAVCIAGGSGLAPMLAIARAAAADGRGLWLFDGARTQRDLCAAGLLTDLPAGVVRYVPVLSAADGAWNGESGFVHEALPRHLDGPLSGYEYYFAGPPPMVEAVQTLLAVQERVPHGQLHFDRFC